MSRERVIGPKLSPEELAENRKLLSDLIGNKVFGSADSNQLGFFLVSVPGKPVYSSQLVQFNEKGMVVPGGCSVWWSRKLLPAPFDGYRLEIDKKKGELVAIPQGKGRRPIWRRNKTIGPEDLRKVDRVSSRLGTICQYNHLLVGNCGYPLGCPKDCPAVIYPEVPHPVFPTIRDRLEIYSPGSRYLNQKVVYLRFVREGGKKYFSEREGEHDLNRSRVVHTDRSLPLADGHTLVAVTESDYQQGKRRSWRLKIIEDGVLLSDSGQLLPRSFRHKAEVLDK